MASYTPNLNLLMKDPVADGADTFNIETMLNENWEKIDRQVLRAMAAAAVYDQGATYQQGDFCTQGGLLYRANQVIAQPEAWSAGHWTEISITDVIRGLTAADVGAAPDGFGLGTKCTNVESLDTINVNGWYAFIGDIAPDNAGWWVAFYTMSGSMGNLLAFKNGFIAQKKKYYDTWGDWEWLNPPMQIEVEYRTTERFNGKPVYRKLINFGQLPNNSTKTVFISDESVNLLSAFGYQYNSNQIIPNGCYGGDASKQVLVGGNGQNLIIATNFTPNETNAYIEVKYTKTAD